MYGLIGEKLGHSFSKTIHEHLWAQRYDMLPMDRTELDRFLRERSFDGVNVTIPYKRTVMPYCDVIDEKAQAIGCVNTLVCRDGRLMGYNTDFDGLSYCLDRAGISLQGKRLLILGSGSTSLTVRAVAKARGVAEITVVSQAGEVNYENVYDRTDPQVIINATPVGMWPNVTGRPVDLRRFAHLEAVADVVYNPLRTELVLQAEELGLPATGGLPMLVVQAVYAARQFCGRTFPQEETEATIRLVERQQCNIVLVGMPGSGKTSVGQALAELSGRELVDIDSEIVRQAGRSIPQIFAQEGEAGFRRREAEVIAQAASEGGKILSTGGGAPLSEENRHALRRSGRVYFLQRELDLLPTEGRPLSQAAQSLAAMYEARLPFYTACADVTVDNNGPLADTAAHIWRDFL